MTNTKNDPTLNDRSIEQLFDDAEADAASLGVAIRSTADTMRHDTHALLSSGVPMPNPHKREWDVIKENTAAYQPDPNEFDALSKSPRPAKWFDVASDKDIAL
jgi:hypothetical protein